MIVVLIFKFYIETFWKQDHFHVLFRENYFSFGRKVLWDYNCIVLFFRINNGKNLSLLVLFQLTIVRTFILALRGQLKSLHDCRIIMWYALFSIHPFAVCWSVWIINKRKMVKTNQINLHNFYNFNKLEK